MPDPFPWPGHLDLSPERLIAVAALIARGRNDALDRYDTKIGDDAWTLGCRAYRFGRYRIEEAATTDDFPWLTVLDPSMQFSFKIGTVPVRFYRGSHDEPTNRTLRISFPEIRQLSLSLPFFSESDEDQTCFRFAVETHEDGEVDRIFFAELRGDTIEKCWEIPFVAPPRILYSVEEPREDGVELPRPPVRGIADSQEGAKNSDLESRSKEI